MIEIGGEKFLDITDLSGMLGLTRRTVSRMVREGRFGPSVKVGRNRYVSEARVLLYMKGTSNGQKLANKRK